MPSTPIAGTPASRSLDAAQSSRDAAQSGSPRRPCGVAGPRYDRLQSWPGKAERAGASIQTGGVATTYPSLRVKRASRSEGRHSCGRTGQFPRPCGWERDIRSRRAGRERTTPAGGESGGRHHGPTRGGGAGAGFMRPAWWLQVHRVPDGPFSKPTRPTVIDECQELPGFLGLRCRQQGGLIAVGSSLYARQV